MLMLILQGSFLSSQLTYNISDVCSKVISSAVGEIQQNGSPLHTFFTNTPASAYEMILYIINGARPKLKLWVQMLFHSSIPLKLATNIKKAICKNWISRIASTIKADLQNLFVRTNNINAVKIILQKQFS